MADSGGNGNDSIRLDGANMRVTFAVRWLGAIMVRGRFDELEGWLQIPNGCPQDAQIDVNVSTGSVHTGIALRDRHLRGAEFLDAARHPAISFRSTRIDRPNGSLVVTGRLSLRGVEREVRATCPATWDANALSDGALVRVQASLDVPRTPHDVGVAHGIHRLNPLLYAIGTNVQVSVELVVPARTLLPALLPLPVPSRAL